MGNERVSKSRFPPSDFFCFPVSGVRFQPRERSFYVPPGTCAKLLRPQFSPFNFRFPAVLLSTINYKLSQWWRLPIEIGRSKALPMLKPNPAFEQFSRRTKETLFRPWKGTIYRVTTLRYAGARTILCCEGSYRNGGRWNAIGSFRAVYGSTEDTVALSESKVTAEYANLPYRFSRAPSRCSTRC